MQILRLLAARRATASSGSESERQDDEGPFFDLDFPSVCAFSFGSSESDSDSDESCEELDFIISLQRSSSASPLKFCASEPPARANSLPSQRHAGRKRGISNLRSLSFGARKTATPLYRGGRHSFAGSSSGRRSFARSSTSSARSFRLFADSPHAAEDDEHHAVEVEPGRRALSRDVIRRCLAKISRRIRTALASPRAAEGKGLRRLRKCRSASCAGPSSGAARRDDDSAVEKQAGIAGAIAHCKESLHQAASESDSPLLRSRSDPGKCEAA